MRLSPEFIEGMDLSELQKLKGTIDVLISKKKDTQKAVLRNKFADLAKKQGMTLADILGAKARRHTVKHKLPAKFINPTDPSQTWSGRGRHPKWFKGKEAQSAAGSAA